MIRWPHQISAVRDVLTAKEAGDRVLCVTSPTGGGKTQVMRDLAQHFLDQERKVVLYTNRKLLIEQITGGLEKAGITHGVRAAGYQDERDETFQVSSLQTENNRVLKSQKWTLHAAELVLIDEAHNQTGPTVQKIIEKHNEAGALIVGLTATPIDIGDIYDQLIVAGTNSELRACGALVPARHYGCSEPDLADIGRAALAKLQAGQDLTDVENAKAVMTPGIYAFVAEQFRRLNPQAKPSILFAPGVRESMWFAEEFSRLGIPAAHIDGDEIWVDGETFQSTPESRKGILARSESGNIKLLCNRFVLREGVDAPWLSHGILACVFGSLKSYLQSGGRLLRAHPSLRHVTIQDHGGNWWRHGSLNADREWSLDMTDRMAAGIHYENATDPKKPKPFVCNGCQVTLIYREVTVDRVATCPECGAKMDLRKRSRPVIQADGTLTEHFGDALKPRPTRLNDDTESLWERYYYRALKSKKGMTFSEARGLFCHEHGYFPPSNLMLMPKNVGDWWRKVRHVPKDNLIMSELTLGVCRSCGQQIRWAKTHNGKPMPLDAVSDPDGKIIVINGVTVMADTVTVTPDTPRYTSHFATCPNAAEHRKKK